MELGMQAIEDAATLLQGQQPLDDERAANALQVLRHLGLDSAISAAAPTLRRNVDNAAALLRVAARMARIFELSSAAAPNAAFMGGTVDPADFGLEPQVFDPAHVSGRGLDTFQAFASCVGEGVEYLSQLEWGGEQYRSVDFTNPPEGMSADSHAAFRAALRAAAIDLNGPVNLVRARVLAGDKDTLVPADECFRMRRRAREYRLKGFGAGCAAGQDTARATLVALLELIERDAAALWWLGGSRGCEIGAELLPAFRDDLDALRGATAVPRKTWLLDITSDLGVPSVAAMSVDASGGDFACGLAAKVALPEAIRAATLELCQMELSNSLVRQKLAEGGEGALNAMDRRHVRRMNVAADCSLLLPARPPRAVEASSFGSPEQQLEWLADRLSRRSVETFVVDLTRPALGISAVRVLAPALQRMPAIFVTERLHRSTSDSESGETLGIDLL
jgi:ribosomal protein S12 methylthiotransferase accessory factor